MKIKSLNSNVTFGSGIMTKRTIAFAIAGLITMSAIIAIGNSEEPTSWDDPVEQWNLIKFSHKLHVAEMEIECGDCHTSTAESVVSSDFLLPQKEQCAECHDVEDEMNCTMCHADANRMEKFARTEREVIFNHKAHIEQEVDCAQCHAGVENAVAASTEYLPAMATCNTCHDGIENDNTCSTCHSMVETLMPASHEQIDWVKEHKRVVRVGGMSNDCSVCHEDNFCQTCHTDASVQFTSGAMVRPVPENRPSPSGANTLVKQSVHGFNYIFMHAADFRSKRSDCYSCHSQESFCNECHQNNQDAGFASPVPLSHSALDFVRIGVGSGGGQHAKLARTDIESCAACHDIEGRDPSCITCHVDRTPGKGNDPQTHSPSFMSGERGDWHDNAASLCFNCHTNSQRSGIGFCGYCHQGVN